MNKLLQNFIVVILILIAIAGIFAIAGPQMTKPVKEISLSELAQSVNQDQIQKIGINGNDLNIQYKNGDTATSRKETSASLSQSLLGLGASAEQLQKVDVAVQKESGSVANWLIPLLSLVLPVIIFAWFFFMIFKQAKSGGNQTFNFLRAPAKMFGDGKSKSEKVTFKDIAGIEEAKDEIKEVVDFLKNPQKYQQIGARIPRGVLLIGPPGTGKTLLARAVANEAGVPFFSIAGSEFVELFVGVGSARVRSLFETAKKNPSAIIFIDEIDSIGKIRGVGLGGGHDEREQTLNQILAEMDGFEKDTGVIVMAATNRPEYLDPALLRPGRFDRRIMLDLPDVKGREEILKIHIKGIPLANNVNLIEIAERTPGFSGADLANLVNEAAIFAARKNKESVGQTDFLESIEKVLMGPERKSHLLSTPEKEIAAYHEAGHALISALLPNAEEVRKVSIIARGMAAGYTLSLPKYEKKMKTKSEFLSELAVLLAGYCAEKIKFNEISTGATNDLEKASMLARWMVTKYGMSIFGPMSFGKRETMPFLGWETEAERNYSDKTADLIDKETERFIKEAEAKALKMLQQKRKLLEKIAKVLIEKETIEKEEFDALINGGKKKKGRK